MTKHWFATAFVIGPLAGATVSAFAQVPTGAVGAAVSSAPGVQSGVVAMGTAPGSVVLAQVTPGAGATPPLAAPQPGQVQLQAQAQPPASPAVQNGVPAVPMIAPVTVLPLAIEMGGGVLLQLPRPAATIIAADPKIARVQPVSPTSIFVIGVSQGRTTLIATNEAGLPITQYEVSVRRAGMGDVVPAAPVAPGGPPPPSARDIRNSTAAAAQAAIRQNVQGAGAVKVAAIEGNLVLSGTVATPQQSFNVETMLKSFLGASGGFINNITVLSSMQVNVQVRVVEMSRTVSRDLGINWKAIGQIGNFSFAYLTPGGFAGNIPSLLANGTNLIGVGYQSGGWDVNALINALAADNLVSVLAEPNLTTQSGEPASFLAGGEFPVPVSQSSGTGNSTNTVEFKQFGIALAVVPTILAPNRISLRVRPEVSEPDFTFAVQTSGSGNRTPGVATRRAETTVELGSGQSFAIAGLLSSKITDNASTLPWLGELPILGALFKSTQFQRRETELVIIVTPYVVQPVSAAAQLRTPIDGFTPATDLNRILYNRQSGSNVRPTTGLPLDAGFILK